MGVLSEISTRWSWTRRVLSAIPDQVVRVYLSGLSKPDDVRRIRQSGADAALVGEALMRPDDPEPLLRSLAEAAREPQ